MARLLLFKVLVPWASGPLNSALKMEPKLLVLLNITLPSTIQTVSMLMPLKHTSPKEELLLASEVPKRRPV